MKTTAVSKLQDLIHEFEIAMLVTRSHYGELRSRPMVLVDVDAEGVLWLLTDRHSGKMEEVAADNHVNVTMQSSRKFVSISGTAAPVDDRQKIDSLWKETWKIWFPDGKDDPNLTLIRIHGETGEYWDNSGIRGIQYLIEAGKAYLCGTRPNVATDANLHAKVDL